MRRKKSRFRKTGLLLTLLVLFSGCGLREVSQSSQTEPSEIEIYYHADDDSSEPWKPEPESEPSAARESAAQEPEKSKEDERIVITLVTARPYGSDTGQYELLVSRFNMANKKYRVELETCSYGEELQTMRDRLLVEVGAGNGPDLMTEDVFPLSQEIMDSGTLVDLTPYLEESGITEETYFPGYAPGVSGDRIYEVCINSIVKNYCLSQEVLGDREIPKDLEGLVDMLLEYPGKGSLLGPQVTGRYILQYFLKGSEDLWGIIDWEENTCDFTAPIFSKILELTKRGRENGKKGYEPVLDTYSIMMTDSSEKELLSKWYPGFVPVGYYFDDGPHYQYQHNSNALMINANTEHLEGAYAFLSYVLSKGGQSIAGEPVNKEVWKNQCMNLVKGNHISEDAYQEKLEMYEDARFAPRRTEEILEIVYDAADGYIEGDQSKEDVIAQIQNRVQLYLNE